VVRDRPKPATPEIAIKASPFLDTVRVLARKPAFWFLAFGAASSSMLGYGIAFWLPSLLQRSFGLSLIETSIFYGSVLLLGGVAGVLAGGWMGDRLGSRDRAYFGYLPALAFVIGVPFFAAGIMTDSVPLAFALFLLPQALAYVWLGPVLSAVQHLVEPPFRATASALFLLINNLIGLGGGIYALGALSDWLVPIYGESALRYSMLYSLALYGLAALLMALAGPHLRRNWVDEV
jgi:MFS family permease